MITLLSYFKNHKLRLFFTVIVKTIGTLSELAVPYILSYVLDDVIPSINDKYKETGVRDITPILLYGGLMILFALSFLILNVMANRMASKTTSLIIEEERNKLYKAIMGLRLKDLDRITIPSLVSRISSDTYNLNQALNNIQRLGIRSPLLFLGGILVCSTLSIRLTLVFFILAPLVLILIFIISRIGIKFFTKIQESSDSLVRVVRENITGARVIKALAKEDYERLRYHNLNNKVMSYELKAGYNMALLNPIVNILLDLGLTFSILYGAYLINDNVIEVGKIIAFTSYFTIISGAMVSIARIFETASKGYASAIRIKYVLNVDSKRDTIELPDGESYIEFKDVSFSYNNNNEYAIKNISFTLENGESLGILGSTGSGKSTILNLLMGFYDDFEGDIYIKNKNIKSINLSDITNSFSSVLQSDILFNDTIRENLIFNQDIDDGKIDEVLKDTDAYDFIHSYKEGLDHVISSKGTDLSGGQRQRVLISRALLNNRPILLLDDSSSALDYKTDAYIRGNLKKYNLTSIIVAQRVSSIIGCSKILVIDDGHIIGYGTHNELLETCPDYKNIYDIQMGDDYNG